MSMICIAVGVVVLFTFVLPTARRLQSESGARSHVGSTSRLNFQLLPRSANVSLEGKDPGLENAAA